MKIGLSVLFLFVFAALCAAADVYQPVFIIPPSPDREFRGVWIATVANKDWPSAPGLSVAQQKTELISLLDTAARLKLNAIIFQVRPDSDAFYDSTIEPWSEYLTGVQGRAPQPYYDPLAFAIEEAHRRGMELHAWFNPFRVRLSTAPSTAPNDVARTHPEWVRHYGGELWLDPGDPAVRDYVLRVIMDVVKRYDVDGVQFDDYFYPYPVSSARGAEISFPDEETWVRFGERSGLSRDDWRRRNIDEFIQNVYQNIKAAKPWVKFGVSPFGIWQPGFPPQIKGFNSYAKLCSDSRLWLINGWLDYLSPQLYWSMDSPAQSFPVLLDWWEHQNVRGRHLWPGLAAYHLPAAEIARQVRFIHTQPAATGEIFFEMRNFQQNPALAAAVSAEFSQPALVPASPWLDSGPPAKPQITAHEERGLWVFQWTAFGASSTAKWVLQYRGLDGQWRTLLFPANQASQSFAFPPQIVSIRAMDRAGVLSQPASVEEKDAAKPAAAKSFWNSYKTR